MFFRPATNEVEIGHLPRQRFFWKCSPHQSRLQHTSVDMGRHTSHLTSPLSPHLTLTPPHHPYLHTSPSHLHITLISTPHPHTSTSPLSPHLTLTPPHHPYLHTSPSHLHITLISTPHPHTSTSPLSPHLTLVPPHHPYLHTSHLTLTPPHRNFEQALIAQGYRCTGCGMTLDSNHSRYFRFCYYTGKYFCQNCHISTLWVVPAYILEYWSFKK